MSRRKKRHGKPKADLWPPIGVKPLECFINENWREAGTANLFCLCQRPDGTRAAAAFEIDLDCVGLREAFGKSPTTVEEFSKDTRRGNFDRLRYIGIEPDEARRLLAGAMRFSRKNGFKLPPHSDSWLDLLGGVGDVDNADLRDFNQDALYYAGSFEFLEERLDGCTPKEFLDRDDVEADLDYEIWPGDEELDEDMTEEEAESAMDEMGDLLAQATDLATQRGLAAIRRWCFANKIVPHPRLEEALDILFRSAPQALPWADENDVQEEVRQAASDHMQQLIDEYAPPQRAELLVAIGQVQSFISSFASADALASALGLDEEAPE